MHTESEWNPPEGSFGTALQNLSPAGKQSVGSERKPVGASSHSPHLSPSFFFFSCTLSCSHLLCRSILLSSSPPFPIVSPSSDCPVYHHPPISHYHPRYLHPTLSSLVVISPSPEDGPGRFHPPIHLSVICWGVASRFSCSSSLSNPALILLSVCFLSIACLPFLLSLHPTRADRERVREGDKHLD